MEPKEVGDGLGGVAVAESPVVPKAEEQQNLGASLVGESAVADTSTPAAIGVQEPKESPVMNLKFTKKPGEEPVVLGDKDQYAKTIDIVTGKSNSPAQINTTPLPQPTPVEDVVPLMMGKDDGVAEPPQRKGIIAAALSILGLGK